MRTAKYYDGTRSLIDYYVPLNILDIKPNMYAISVFGEIMSIITGNILSQTESYASGGYRSIGLQTNNNTRKSYYIHILVAISFIPKTDEDILMGRDIVNHKNLIVDDNCYTNLEWVNRKENELHYLYNLNNNSIPVKLVVFDNSNNWKMVSNGENNGMSRLNNETVHTICKLLEQGFNYKEILDQIGLEYNDNNRHLLYNIKLRRRWKEISQYYNF